MDDRRDEPIHLLIVDDELDAVQDLQMALQDLYHFIVTCVSTGDEAVRLVADKPEGFDVALIDQNLDEVMNGVEVMQALFKHNRFLPVLLFTGQELQQDYVEAITSGAYLYVPVQRADIQPVHIARYCWAAVHDRAMRWQAAFQDMSQALHSLSVDHVLDMCVAELAKLGYAHVEIYRYISAPKVEGWDTDGFGLVQSRAFLRCERPEIGLYDPIDLAEPSQVRSILLSHRGLEVLQDGDDIRVFIPLHGKVELGIAGSIAPEQSTDAPDLTQQTSGVKPSAGGVIGLLLLRHFPRNRLEREKPYLTMLGQQMALALQNALTYEQLEYQRQASHQILGTNHEILALKFDTSSSYNILDRFAEAIATALNFTRVAIAMLDKAKDTVMLHGQYGLTAAEKELVCAREVQHAEFRKLHRKNFKQPGNSYFIPEQSYKVEEYTGFFLRPEAYDAQPWDWHAADMLRTEVVNSKGDTVGYILSEREQDRRRPDYNTFIALEIFATQIAVAIENIHYQRYQRDINVIQQVGVAISNTLDRKILFSKVHSALKLLMPADVLLIGRYHREMHEIEVLYRETTDPIDREVPERWLDTEGVSGYIVREGASLCFDTKAKNQQFHEENHIQPLGTLAESWLGVPLKVDDEVIGVIIAQDYNHQHVYGPQDERLITILADQIAIALRRIELEEANYESVINVGLELSRANFTLPQVQKLILERACQLTKSDYGLIMLYEKSKRGLSVSQNYIANRNIQFKKKGGSYKKQIGPDLFLPLQPRRGEPAGLTIKVARSKKPQRWNDVHKDPDYIEVVETTNSQISVPILSGKGHLLGVLTLEANRFNAFEQGHENMLLILGQFMALSFMRAIERAERDELFAWGIYDLDSRLIRHNSITRVQGLRTDRRSMLPTFKKLFAELQALYEQAPRIHPMARGSLEQRSPIVLKTVVDQFLKDTRTLYDHPTITLDYKNYPSDHPSILANEQGLHYALKILVDNAFEQVSKEDFGHIELVTDLDETGVVLQVSNTGLPLDPQMLDFINQQEIDGDLGNQSLSKLKLLARLYGASLQAINSTAGVTFRLVFPTSQPELLILAPLEDRLQAAVDAAQNRRISETQLYRLQRSVASHSALLFAGKVRQQGPQLYDELNKLGENLSRIDAAVATLAADVDTQLDQPSLFSVQMFLDSFILYRPMRENEVPVIWDGKRVANDVKISANQAGLKHVMTILVDNAQEAIQEQAVKQLEEQYQPHSIKIRVDTNAKWVFISVQNTGSVIPEAIYQRLFNYPIVKANNTNRGSGLLMSRVLLARYGSKIRVTRNSPKEGVVFTIQFPRL